MNMRSKKQADGFKIQKTEYISKTFRLERELVERLAEYAARDGVSVNTLIAQCCEYALSRSKQGG